MKKELNEEFENRNLTFSSHIENSDKPICYITHCEDCVFTSDREFTLNFDELEQVEDVADRVELRIEAVQVIYNISTHDLDEVMPQGKESIKEDNDSRMLEYVNTFKAEEDVLNKSNLYEDLW